MANLLCCFNLTAKQRKTKMCVLLDDEMTTKSLGHGNYSPLFFQKSAQIGR